MWLHINILIFLKYTTAQPQGDTLVQSHQGWWDRVQDSSSDIEPSKKSELLDFDVSPTCSKTMETSA